MDKIIRNLYQNKLKLPNFIFDYNIIQKRKMILKKENLDFDNN